MSKEKRLRVSERDIKSGKWIQHKVLTFAEAEKKILRARRKYFWTPLMGYWRRKTLKVVLDTIYRFL